MARIHHCIYAAVLSAVLVLYSSVAAQGVVVNSIFNGEVSEDYSDPNNWSPPEVPNNTATRSYNVTVPGRVHVDMNVRISNLNANGIVIPGGASVIVIESATIGTLPTPDPSGYVQSGLTLLQGGLFTVEGTLTNFDASTRTLKGGAFYVSGVAQSGGVSVLRFRGADIVHNASSLELVGSMAQIVDENGLNALRNLASNTAEGSMRVAQRNFATSGAFTNAGRLSVAFGTFTVAGPLTNFDPATRTLSGGTYVIGRSGVLRFSDADIVRNAASIDLVEGGLITNKKGNNGLRNLAFNESGARFVAPDRFTTAGSFTNAGEVIISSPFGPGGGKFTMAQGQSYVQTGGSTALDSGDFTGNMQISGGELSASSSFDAGTARINGNLTVGDALLRPRELLVNGNVQFGASTRLRVVVLREEHLTNLAAALVVDGTVALAGSINLEEPDAFPAPSGSVYQAVRSEGLTGTFSNATDGGRVTTTSGRGSYVVTYGTRGVLVGSYQRIPPAAQLLNISTRAKVSTGNDVAIGGFIIYGAFGNEPKKVVVRGIGPSLAQLGVSGVLEDPTIELHDSSGNIIARNDSWQEAQADALRASGLAPEDERESAIIATLPRGAYTVVLRGRQETQGVGLVEVYDPVKGSKSKLVNMSTRGFVDADNLLIGGYISGGKGRGAAELTLRAIGPGLQHSGVSGFLPDPTLEVRDKNGELVAANDDHFTPAQNHRGVLPGLNPYEEKDAATGVILPRGQYTVLVRGKGDASGIALVEIFDHNR